MFGPLLTMASRFTQTAEQGFGKNKEKFTYKDERGAFVGPYALFTAAPKVGRLAMELVYRYVCSCC